MRRVLRVSDCLLVGCAVIAVTLLYSAGFALAGPALGQFELKTLEAGADHLEFQSQNAYSWNQPRRRHVTENGELIFDDNSVVRQRHALEVEKGLSDFMKFRLGIEFEAERIDDPDSIGDANSFNDVKLEEVGGEVIWVLLPREGDGFGLGFVAEIERPLENGEPMSVLASPIVEVGSGPWLFRAVPGLFFFWGGDTEGGRSDNKADFSYAAALSYEFSDTWTLALEGYGTVERLFNRGNPPEEVQELGEHDLHRLGPIIYYTQPLGPDAPDLRIGTGFLAGLNNATPDATLKLSLELDF